MKTKESGLRPRLPWVPTEVAARAAKVAASSDGYQGDYAFFEIIQYRSARLRENLMV